MNTTMNIETATGDLSVSLAGWCIDRTNDTDETAFWFDSIYFSYDDSQPFSILTLIMSNGKIYTKQGKEVWRKHSKTEKLVKNYMIDSSDYQKDEIDKFVEEFSAKEDA